MGKKIASPEGEHFMKKNQQIILLSLTPIFIILSHHLAMLPHEFSHSFIAWLLGDKSNPLNLNYGGAGWQNLLYLANMDENVDYKAIFNNGHHWHAALIAFAGAGIANGLMFIISLILLKNEKIKQHLYGYYFLFWFNLMNLGNFYCYVPIRTFSSSGGDVAHFATALNISPWWIYIIAGSLVAYLIWHFFTRALISAYINLKLYSTVMQAIILIPVCLVLFGFFGAAGFFNYGEISYFLSGTSMLLIPVSIIAAWPTRVWVRTKLLC